MTAIALPRTAQLLCTVNIADIHSARKHVCGLCVHNVQPTLKKAAGQSHPQDGHSNRAGELSIAFLIQLIQVLRLWLKS